MTITQRPCILCELDNWQDVSALLVLSLWKHKQNNNNSPAVLLLNKKEATSVAAVLCCHSEQQQAQLQIVLLLENRQSDKRYSSLDCHCVEQQTDKSSYCWTADKQAFLRCSVCHWREDQTKTNRARLLDIRQSNKCCSSLDCHCRQQPIDKSSSFWTTDKQALLIVFPL